MPVLDRVYVIELYNAEGVEVNISYETKRTIEAVLPAALKVLLGSIETI